MNFYDIFGGPGWVDSNSWLDSDDDDDDDDDDDPDINADQGISKKNSLPSR